MTGVNWAAIFLAAVADWVFGAVWFRAFATQWQAGSRMSPQELAYWASPRYWPYLIALLCSIGLAYVIARIISHSQTHGLFRGLSTGILVGLAAAVAMWTEMVFEARAGSFILISAAYPLLGCILMGVIIGAWKPKSLAASAVVTR